MSHLVTQARRTAAWLLFVGIPIALFLAPEPAAAANCATSGPAGGAYTVTVCITSPADGSTLTGNNTVAASVTVSGTNPGVQRVISNMDGKYLITDFQSTYSFILPTANYVDGSHTLQTQALMRDGFTTTLAGITVTFSNGVTTPPVNTNTFTPSAGTQPAAGQPFLVAAVGDGAGGEVNETNVVKLISGWKPNLFLYLGDVYEKGSPLEFYNWYAPSGFYGGMNSITNPTIGNHEYSTGSPAGYFNYWNNIPNYYSYNAGGWHFISLNANSAFNQYGTTSAQYQWLQQDLAANTAACTVVYYHQPLFNIGPEGSATSMSTIWSLLYANHVTLVLNGHDHDYQRWVPLDGNGNPAANGITEIVAGTGGHGIQTFSTTDSRLAIGLDTTSNFGALALQLGATSARFAFVNTAGTTMDSGTLNCRGTAAPTVTPTPTATATATATATSTATPTSTPASAPSATPTSTATATATPTSTTAAAPTATPTSTLPPLTPTNTPLPPTATPTNTPPPPTPTNTTVPPTPTSTSSGSTVTFVPAADSYVNQNSPSSNYGTSTSIRLDASPILNTYIRFNVQNLTGTIQSVTLRIFANSSGAGYSVRSVADNTWGETTITYANAPAMAATATGSVAGFTLGTWTSVDVTSLVTGNGTYSFGLTTTSGTQMNLASRESGATAEQLVVQLAPAAASPLIAAGVRTAATPTLTRTATPTAAIAPSIVQPAATRTSTPTATRTATATLRPPASPTPTLRPPASPTPTLRPPASPTPTLRPPASPTPTLRPPASPTPTRARPSPTNTRQPAAPAATPTRAAPTPTRIAPAAPRIAPNSVKPPATLTKPTATPTATRTATPTVTRTATPTRRVSPAARPTPAKPAAFDGQDWRRLLLQLLALSAVPWLVGVWRVF